MTCKKFSNSFSGLKGAAVFVALFVFLCAGLSAQEQDITLSASEGNFSVSGRFLGFDGRFIRIETIGGEVTLSHDGLVCAGVTCPDLESFVPTIRLSGAQRMADAILSPLISAYARDIGATLDVTSDDAEIIAYKLRQPGADQDLIHFFVRSTTSSNGFADLLSNDTDIVMSAREVNPVELAMVRQAGLGSLDRQGNSRILALDAMVPVVSLERAIAGISLDTLSRIFAGEVTNWAEIGGEDGEIALHLLPAWMGQTQGFEGRILGSVDRAVAPTVQRHDTVGDLASAIMVDPNSIGVLPFGALGDTQTVQLHESCGAGARAELSSLKTEDYPLTMPLFLYTPQRRLHPEVDEFLGWLRRPSAQLVIRRAGFVDQAAIPIPLARQGERLAQAIIAAGDEVPLIELQRMMRVLGPQVRLSTTFRFEIGSTRLDAQSRSKVLQLARDIHDGRHDGRVLMLVGFSDGRGPAKPNRDLSSARAESVRRAVVEALGEGLPQSVTIETEAFGEALPMGCDDTEWGRQINRRVELWVAQRR